MLKVTAVLLLINKSDSKLPDLKYRRELTYQYYVQFLLKPQPAWDHHLLF